MTELEHEIYVLQQTVDGDRRLLSPLLFPEYCRLTPASDPPRQFSERIHELVTGLPNSKRYRRLLSDPPSVESVTVELSPTRKQKKELTLLSELNIKFDLIVWRHQNSVTIGYVPALQIEIVRECKFDEAFLDLASKEIFSCLQRNRFLANIGKLIEFSRYSETTIRTFPTTIDVLSPKEEELATKEKADESETLRKVASILRSSQISQSYQIGSEVSRLREILFGVVPESVLIIGSAGVGKTSLLYELIRNRYSFKLGQVEFWETSGSRIVSGMSGFGQWQERCQKVIDELRKKNAVLHLGNLFELLHVGKSVNQKQGIATFLRPYIERGTIRVVAECLPEQISLLEKEDPQLLSAFQQLTLKKPDQQKCLKILSSEAASRGHTKGPIVEQSALETINRLHQRYATYSAVPARPIRFLRNLISDATASTTIQSEDVISRFADETGLPFFLLSQEAPLNVEQTQDWFSQRVIGQPEPVDLVVDMIASIKANMTSGKKPIASFLFIGPTGVGKTEMAKSIAEFMFSDPQRMIRFDMSEYSNQLSIERLIGDNSGNDGLLTGRIRQSPFSVVLLDEFEKAHASFFDLLLQVLGEGRLTDSRGRVTDFSTTIVIMTSNLGAANLKLGSFGFNNIGSSTSHAKAHFSREVQKFVRPELYNRIDRVVPFDPLSNETIRKVTRREIEKLRKREGLWFRPLNFSFADSAIDLVAELGHDHRYGARPIQRFIQDKVVVSVAEKLNRYAANTTVDVSIDVKHGKLFVDAKAQPPTRNFQKLGETKDPAKISMLDTVKELRANRRRAQSLFHCPIANRVRNEHFRIQQQFRKFEKRQNRLIKLAKNSDEALLHQKRLWERKAELEKYDQIMTSIDQVKSAAIELEETALTGYLKDAEGSAQQIAADSFEMRKQTNRALFNLFVFDSDGNEATTIFFFGRKLENAMAIVNAYQKIAVDRKFQFKHFVLRRHTKASTEKQTTGEPDAHKSSRSQGVDHAANAKKSFEKPLFSMQRELTGQESLDIANDEIATDLAKVTHFFASSSKLLDKAAENEKQLTDLIVADVFATDLTKLNQAVPHDAIGLAIEFRGVATFPLFIGEAGMHRFRNLNSDSILVQVIGGKMYNHRLPHETATNGPYNRDDKRRSYNLTNQMIADRSLSEVSYSNLENAIADLIESGFQRHLDLMLLNGPDQSLDILDGATVVVTN